MLSRLVQGPAGLWLLCVLTLVVYLPGLGGDFLLDDYSNLAPFLAMDRGELGAWEVLTQNTSGPLGRPVSMLSFLANWSTTGPGAFGFKLTNLLIHLLSGCLLYFLSRRLLAARLPSHAGSVALWISAMWLLAPIHVSTVLYVVQRMAQLSALFTLLGLLVYLIGRERLATHPTQARRRILLAFFLFTPLAALSKETGALLPALLLLLELFWFRFEAPAPQRRFLGTVFLIGLALPATLALGLLLVEPERLLAGYALRDFDLTQRLLSQPRVMLDYLLNLLSLPGGSALGIYHDDFPVSRSPWSPATTLPTLGLWLALLGLGWRTRAGDWAPVGFGIWFFVVAQALESSFFPLELYFEHRIYLPAVGVFIGLGYAMGRLLNDPRRQKAIVILLLLTPLIFAISSAARSTIWRSWESILVAGSVGHPGSPRVHSGLTNLYMGRGETRLALDSLARSRQLSPWGVADSGLALQEVAAYCSHPGPVPERVYQRFKRLRGPFFDALTASSLSWLADMVEQGKCPGLDAGRILPAVSKGLARGPEDGERDFAWSARAHLGRLARAAGDLATARAALHGALSLYPGRLSAGILLIRVQLDLADAEGARKTLTALEPFHAAGTVVEVRALEELQRQTKRKQGNE